MIAAGKLERKITIERRLQADAEDKPAFVDGFVCRAQVKPIKASERLSEGPIAECDLEFVIRYSSEVRNLSPKDQIKYAGVDGVMRFYDIAEVTEIGFHEELSIKAKLRDRVNG